MDRNDLPNVPYFSKAGEASAGKVFVVRSMHYVEGVQLCPLCRAAFAMVFFAQSAPKALEHSPAQSLPFLSGCPVSLSH